MPKKNKHRLIHIENPTRCNSVSKLISYLYEAVSVQQLHVQQPSTYEKPEAASAVLGS
jgi:hypothetical protein